MGGCRNFLSARSEHACRLAFCWPIKGEYDARHFARTARERGAFALTDAVTLLSETHVPRDVYDEAAAQFTEPELAQLISLILTINAWNRIAVTTRLEPGT